MILQDVVDLARLSELSSTALKDDPDAIMLFLNMGLIEIHKRFAVKVEEHIVTLIEGTSLYPLPADFMYALTAYGETSETDVGEVAEVSINDATDPFSVFIPSYKQIQVPLTATGAYVSLTYVAKPLSYDVDDLAEELDLPDTLVEPLLHYIGYKAHLGIRGDAQSENNAHFYRFEKACDKARELGVAVPMDPLDMGTRIHNRGFV